MAIIKCPECGHEVSDAAEKCPNCGVAIVGNVKTCPDCGRVVLKSAEICPSCGTKFQMGDAAGVTAAKTGGTRIKYQNLDPYAPVGGQKKSHKGVAVGVVVTIVAAGLFFLAYTLVSKAQRERSEQECYEDVIVSSDTAFYNQFLSDYPDGKHYDEVKTRLDKLVSETNDWKAACLKNTREGYVSFLGKHHGCQYEQACKDKVDSLDFADALSTNTAESFQNYVSNHPGGKYLAQATQIQSKLEEMIVRPEESWRVRKQCSTFFMALQSNDSETLVSTVAPVMDNFLNKQNATNADVVTFANNFTAKPVLFAVNKDYRIHKIAMNNGEYSYGVSFSVEESVSNTNGETETTRYMVRAIVNPQMKISSINMKRALSDEENQ